MYRLVTLVFFSTALDSLLSQETFEFSGYVMELPTLQEGTFDATGDRGGHFSASLTRVRIRPTWLLTDHLRLSWEHEADVFYSSRRIGNQPAASSNRQWVDLRWRLTSGDHMLVDHFVDRAYLRWDGDRTTIVAGRQRIAWGTGRIWNPTDLFNPINPADFGKIEKDGADAISAKWNFGNLSDLQTVVLPQETLAESHAGARFRSNIGETDWSVMTGYFDRRMVWGADLAGNLGTAGVRAEGAFFSKRNAGQMDFCRLTTGIDYQFSPRLYGLAEYYFNGGGHSDKARYDFTNSVKEGNLQLGRQYVFTQVSYLFHALVTQSLSSNVNMLDGSGFIQFATEYSASSWMQIGAGAIWFYGRDASEYDYYSDALYVRLTVYF